MANIKKYPHVEYTKGIKYKARSLIYTAGPYTSPLGTFGVWQNLFRASKVAHELVKYGYAVICPHLNTQYLDGVEVSPRMLVEQDLEMIRRCDGIVLVEGWEHSYGTRAEIKFCNQRKVPVYLSVADLLTKRAVYIKHVRDDVFKITEVKP
jgi:nucleoside 2-deoxyribosyltransferase